ncbi:MAG: hypothetical protein NC131_12880 [Roseburia sp.]|nr:hypothetical protein [Roseburia sp.]
MSAKIKPSFTVDGKHYEFYYSKAMQCEYQRMGDEKKQDKQYQAEVAEYTRLQDMYEKIHTKYAAAMDAYLDNPTDKDLKTVYNELKAIDKEAFDEFNAFAAEHPSADGRDFVMDALEKLVLYALQEQHKLSADEAKNIWSRYVRDNTETGAMLWLSCMGNAFFTDVDENEENPFITAQMAKIEQSNNRRIGLTKIKK